MSLILRIDVDSPYGKRNLFVHLLSRLTSDFTLPRFPLLPYLSDLEWLLDYLNQKNISAYFFFRKCTVPTLKVSQKIKEGNHKIGLHLENSSSVYNFENELEFLSNKVNEKIDVFSKHGSGKYKYGKHHYAPYEPDKYLEWGKKLGMRIFFGNLEDPTISSENYKNELLYFPSAYWLEPYWRDTKLFTKDWLIKEANERDIVLLLHAENIVNNKMLLDELDLILTFVPIKTIE